jgi:hypothetical protein
VMFLKNAMGPSCFEKFATQFLTPYLILKNKYAFPIRCFVPRAALIGICQIMPRITRQVLPTVRR